MDLPDFTRELAHVRKCQQIFYESTGDEAPEVTDAGLIAIALNDLGVSYLQTAKSIRERKL